MRNQSIYIVRCCLDIQQVTKLCLKTNSLWLCKAALRLFHMYVMMGATYMSAARLRRRKDVRHIIYLQWCTMVHTGGLYTGYLLVTWVIPMNDCLSTMYTTVDTCANILLCKAVQLLELFYFIANVSRGNLPHVWLGTAIHNCSSSGSLFFATLRQNN